MSRVKQFIHDNSDLPIQDIQELLHSTQSSQKEKIQDFDFLFQFLIFYFLKIK